MTHYVNLAQRACRPSNETLKPEFKPPPPVLLAGRDATWPRHPSPSAEFFAVAAEALIFMPMDDHFGYDKNYGRLQDIEV